MASHVSKAVTTPLNPDDLSPALETLLDFAKKAGATSADAIATEGRSFSIGVRAGELEDVDHSEGRDMGLRVFVGNRQACVSTSDVSKDTLAMIAQRCVDMAKIAPEDPYCGLPDKATLCQTAEDLDLFDPTVMDPDTLKDRAKSVEAAALNVEGVRQVEGASSTYSSSAIFFATTDGFAKGWRSSRHSLSVTALAEKDGYMERDYDYDGARWLSDVKSPESIGTLAGKRVLARLGPKQLKSENLPVIFDRRISGSFLSALIGSISGPSITRGNSFLKDKLGEQIFRSDITVMDDPLIKRGHGSRPWDGEGLPVKVHKIIDKGRLTTWVLNTSSARQLGLNSTGHAFRSSGAPPGVASTNVHMSAGTQSLETIIASLPRGLWVTEMFGPSLNSNTGDYSVGVSGFFIENGEVAFPVSEITVAGNLNEIFKTLVPADDLIFDGATVAPSLFIESLAVAGS